MEFSFKNNEPFTLYRDGKPLKISTSIEIGPIIRLCSTENEIFLLNKNHNVYKGSLISNFDNESNDVILINLWKSQIIDIDIWEDQIYIILENGQAYTSKISEHFDDNKWKKINFENTSNESVILQRIKCNSIGQIFITNENVLYGSGNSGEVLTSKEPVKLKCFENRKVIDFSAGEDFFIVLTTGKEFEEEDEGLSVESFSDIVETTTPKEIECAKNITLKRTDTVELEFEEDEKSSKDSLISKSSDSCEHIDINIRNLIHEGHNLVRTSVCSFGVSNNGVLGTGDHIKRHGLNGVVGLEDIGVCAVSCGREHSLARTIDGRLFHWGLNSQQQLNGNSDTTDFSAPKELHLNNLIKKSKESYILDSVCDNFSTVVLMPDLKIKKNAMSSFDTDFVLHSTNTERGFPLILASNGFLLQNHKDFAKNYQTFLQSMQGTVRNCIKHRFCVTFVKRFQKLTPPSSIAQYEQFNSHSLNEICLGYFNALNILAVCLKTVENFYRDDINFDQLLFLTHWKEMIKVFEDYSKSYCDIKSTQGFADITHAVIDLFAIGEDEDCEIVFAYPFGQISNILKFIEQLLRDYSESACHLMEKLSQWQNLSKKHCVNIELADHTKEFWLKNSKNVQLRPFKKNNRRVILDSGNIPLKLSRGGTFSTHSFILFSDCFCQYGSQLQTFPLNTLWVSIDGENSIKVITPEKNFVLITRMHDHKMIWFDQIENAIKAALGRPVDEKLSSVRVTGYTFSEKHSKYPNVRCYGRWKFGVMHGNCYLEYPDGIIYYGDMKLGEMTGYGKMVLPSHGIYEGYFQNGKFKGRGVYEMKDNQIYEGNFRDGKFYGHGVLRTNSYVYTGEFVSNEKSGYGVLDDLVSGNKYMGMFAENKRTGPGIYVTMSGDYFEGFFVNDELCGEGVAVFENGYYYEGELTINGPSGKGCYYLPHAKDETNNIMIGNIISGNLGGTWNDVRILSGSVSMNQKFSKYPRRIGELIVDCNRKWRTLFDNWEEEVFRSLTIIKVKHIWNKIAIFITNQRERERSKEQLNIKQLPANYFAKNITLQSNYADLSLKFSNSLDKISLKSSLSLYSRKSPLEFKSHRKSYSNETLFDYHVYDKISGQLLDIEAFQSFLNGSSTLIQYNNNKGSRQSNCSRSSSIQSSSTEGSPDHMKTISDLDYIPNYGINSLTENDLNAIKEYLSEAFKESYHPLSILYERISNCFYSSYGCWKGKPTPILSIQAMHEWESISLRIYKIVRKMFPALPADFCVIDGFQEVVSHVSLLYPVVLSEGIYSTLFVLYANKYNEKDELYRQKVLIVEKQTDIELAALVDLDSQLLNIIKQEQFKEAVTTFKQITEKFCPQEMLNVCAKSVQLIDEAFKNSSENPVILGADNMMPLIIFLLFRSGVPHLGAELALLEDFLSNSSYETEMSGFAGYCYTTIKAGYEHIASEKVIISQKEGV